MEVRKSTALTIPSKPPDSLAKEAEKKRRVFRQTHPAYELAATILGCNHTTASDGWRCARKGFFAM